MNHNRQRPLDLGVYVAQKNPLANQLTDALNLNAKCTKVDGTGSKSQGCYKGGIQTGGWERPVHQSSSTAIT